MLPSVDTNDELNAMVADEALLRPACQDLLDQLGLTGVPLIRFDDGSLPVYAVGEDMVLKLYPGFEAAESVREARVLHHLWGQLPVPTPRLIAADQYKNGWRYVLMSRLPGTSLAQAWPRIAPLDRDRLISQAGEVLAALHELDHKPLGTTVGPPDWGRFLQRQREDAVRHHRSVGLAGPWLEQIPEFLDAVPLPVPDRSELTLLHTEFMREHLTVDPRDGFRMTGLFDFEPAMIGDPAYDFVSVGLYVSRGQPRLLRRFYQAYGREPYDPYQLMAHTLLHVYSDLPWYLRELPPPPEPRLDALAETWFGTEG
ncbi:aminoglycoside phosphotransferase [Actinobacteria bacterium OK074]|nr:aminoglycoside phosphotransferase [Actinobacteria bacterium OK074]